MRTAILPGLILMLAAAGGLSAHAATFDAPLQPASDGQMQCYSPDAARKTCQSLAAYRLGAKGDIDNIAITLLSRDPAITMRTVSPVTVRAGQVCGLIRAEDLQGASFTINDQPADADQTAALRQKIGDAMKDVIGKEVCTAYVPAPGGGLTAKATIGGVPQPDADLPVVWVAPSDGYKVAP